MVWRILRKRLKMKPYVIQLVQQLKQKDYGKRMNYATFMQESMEDETMADRLIFSDESTFHITRWSTPTLEYGGSHICIPTSSKALDRSKWRCRRCLLLLATEISGLDTLRLFSMGYVKDRVYVPPMPKIIEELQVRICNALASATEQMLQNVWREMDYRLDVVRVTEGSHIEHL
ncbi:hypothetical protein AVEN_23557-1 [Araneus ventricosus]|uniref:Uncharacterized protein n=1 Tax=Araneus ventricosus TaxID=182803 RepID=A0A4Y2GP00_ARAVE|nr:hypothetical protein AVEN_23557-1 [Araneus ventricosus]